jgi:hypothetical protein
MGSSIGSMTLMKCCQILMTVSGRRSVFLEPNRASCVEKMALR